MQKDLIFRPDDDLLKIAAEMLRIGKRLYPDYKSVFLFFCDGNAYLGLYLGGGWIRCKLASVGPVEQPYYWLDRDYLLRAIDSPKSISTFTLWGTGITIRRGEHTFHLPSLMGAGGDGIVKSATKILTMPAHIFAIDTRLVLKSAAEGQNGHSHSENIRFEKNGGIFIITWTNGETLTLLKETYPLDQDFTVRHEPLLLLASLSTLKKKRFVTASIGPEKEVYFTCGSVTACANPSIRGYYEVARYLDPRDGKFSLSVHADAVLEVLDILHGSDQDCIVLKQTKGHPRIDLFVVNPDKLNTDNFLKTSFPLRAAADTDLTALFNARLFYKAVAAFEGKKVTISSSSRESDSSFCFEVPGGDLRILLMPKRADMVKLNNFISLYKK